jgi:hypothetical protein
MEFRYPSYNPTEFCTKRIASSSARSGRPADVLSIFLHRFISYTFTNNVLHGKNFGLKVSSFLIKWKYRNLSGHREPRETSFHPGQCWLPVGPAMLSVADPPSSTLCV